jgi:hypothetical protein
MCFVPSGVGFLLVLIPHVCPKNIKVRVESNGCAYCNACEHDQGVSCLLVVSQVNSFV